MQFGDDCSPDNNYHVWSPRAVILVTDTSPRHVRVLHGHPASFSAYLRAVQLDVDRPDIPITIPGLCPVTLNLLVYYLTWLSQLPTGKCAELAQTNQMSKGSRRLLNSLLVSDEFECMVERVMATYILHDPSLMTRMLRVLAYMDVPPLYQLLARIEAFASAQRAMQGVVRGVLQRRTNEVWRVHRCVLKNASGDRLPDARNSNNNSRRGKDSRRKE